MSPVTATPSSTSADAFRAGYFDALGAYASRFSEPADLIVAIPRKAPRLLELIHESSELPDIPLELVISDRALPFIPRTDLTDSRVVLTDDTVIYGSTFAGALETLEESGARVRPEVLGLSRSANSEVASRLGRVPLRLNESQVHSLIDLEIQAFGSLEVPYDIDHPIVRFDLEDDIEDICDRLTAKSSTVESTRGWQRENQIRVFTVSIPSEIASQHSQAAHQLGPRKLRLFIDQERQSVRVVGLFCLAMREAELANASLFSGSSPSVSAAWKDALETVDQAGWTERHRFRALTGTAHYLASVEATSRWLASDDCPFTVGDLNLRAFDLHLLFGHQLGDRMKIALEQALADGFRNHPTTEETFSFDPEAESDAILAGPLGPDFDEALRDYLAFTHPEDPGDRSHALFNAQRKVYDAHTRHPGGPDPERLLQSLVAIPAVTTLLNRYDCELTSEQFDHWCDLAIDGGSIVPYYHPSASQPDLWVRCVRAGERRNEKLKYWVHGLISDATSQLKLLGKPSLSWYVAEKTAATVASCLEPEVRNELRKTVKSGRDEFGARAVLPEVEHEPWLLDWADGAGVIQRDRTGSGTTVQPTAHFAKLFPDSGNTVTNSLRTSTSVVVSAFITLQDSFKGEARERAILAISTCASEEEFLLSISTELDVWLNSSRFGASGLAVDVRAAHHLEKNHLESLERRLGQSAAALRQTESKRAAFKARQAIRDELDEKFASDPDLAPYSIGWTNYLRPRIDEFDSSGEEAGRFLVLAALVGRRAIAIVRAVLGERDLAPADGHTVERHVDSFNTLLTQAEDEGMGAQLPGQLKVSEFDQDLDAALARSSGLILDVESYVDHVWRAHGHADSGAILERVREDHAILMWDLRGSSKGDPAAVGEVIHQANEEAVSVVAREGGKGFHESQDDGACAVFPTVASAIRVFEELRTVFEARGHHIRGSVESTVDADKLQRNKITGEFNGKPFQLTARALAAFKEAESSDPRPSFTLGDGTSRELSPPVDTSYLNLTRRSLQALEIEQKESSFKDPLESLVIYGTINEFQPRVKSTLPTEIVCFVPET